MSFNKPFTRLLYLFKSPQFIGLTLFGNIFILTLSIVFYQLEKNINPGIHNWLDAVWWTFSTVTTVGYGDIVPVTSTGKIFGILSMLLGTGFFASYTALFANALLDREFVKLGRKIKVMYKNVENLKDGISEEEEEVLEIISQLKGKIERLENKINQK
jgi:voltage-gated potassium channel